MRTNSVVSPTLSHDYSLCIYCSGSFSWNQSVQHAMVSYCIHSGWVPNEKLSTVQCTAEWKQTVSHGIHSSNHLICKLADCCIVCRSKAAWWLNDCLSKLWVWWGPVINRLFSVLIALVTLEIIVAIRSTELRPPVYLIASLNKGLTNILP